MTVINAIRFFKRLTALFYILELQLDFLLLWLYISQVDYIFHNMPLFLI